MGTGIAPFRAFVKHLYRDIGDWRGQVRLFYGARSGLELLYMNDEVDAATTQILNGPPGSEIGTRGFDIPDAGDRQRLFNLAPLIPEDRRVSRRYRGRGELIDHIFATNWRGPFAAIRSLRPMLEKGDDAIVINEARMPVPFMPVELPGTYINAGHAGGLGWGLGTAIGQRR